MLTCICVCVFVCAYHIEQNSGRLLSKIVLVEKIGKLTALHGQSTRIKIVGR